MSAEPRSDVKDLLTSGAVVACFYASRPTGQLARPDCETLARVRYGPIALCASCDLRRSAVGKGTAPVALADPTVLLEIAAASDRATRAETDLAQAVAVARAAGHPWSAVAAVLGISRQGAQQRFTPTRAHRHR